MFHVDPSPPRASGQNHDIYDTVLYSTCVYCTVLYQYRYSILIFSHIMHSCGNPVQHHLVQSTVCTDWTVPCWVLCTCMYKKVQNLPLVASYNNHTHNHTYTIIIMILSHKIINRKPQLYSTTVKQLLLSYVMLCYVITARFRFQRFYGFIMLSYMHSNGNILPHHDVELGLQGPRVTASIAVCWSRPSQQSHPSLHCFSPLANPEIYTFIVQASRVSQLRSYIFLNSAILVALRPSLC